MALLVQVYEQQLLLPSVHECMAIAVTILQILFSFLCSMQIPASKWLDLVICSTASAPNVCCLCLCHGCQSASTSVCHADGC